jgi:hypothetical protein
MKPLIAIAIAALTQINGNQPYSITTDKPTKALTELCRADSNCMDIETINVGMHDRLVKADCYTHISNDKRYWVIITPTPDCLEIAYPKGEL